MRIIAFKTLREFYEKHRDCEEELKAWFKETKAADWKSPEDLKKQFHRMKPIRTKKQYESALKRLEKIFDAKRGTKEFDEAEILIILIEDY